MYVYVCGGCCQWFSAFLFLVDAWWLEKSYPCWFDIRQSNSSSFVAMEHCFCFFLAFFRFAQWENFFVDVRLSFCLFLLLLLLWLVDSVGVSFHFSAFSVYIFFPLHSLPNHTVCANLRVCFNSIAALSLYDFFLSAFWYKTFIVGRFCVTNTFTYSSRLIFFLYVFVSRFFFSVVAIFFAFAFFFSFVACRNLFLLLFSLLFHPFDGVCVSWAHWLFRYLRLGETQATLVLFVWLRIGYIWVYVWSCMCRAIFYYYYYSFVVSRFHTFSTTIFALQFFYYNFFVFSLCALCYFFLLFYYDFLLFFHVASFILRCSYSCTISIHKAKQRYTQHLMKPFIHLYKLKALTRSLAFANWFVLPPAVQVKWKQRFFSTVSASAVIVVVVIVMCII